MAKNKFKKDRNEVAKNKTIDFELSKEMTMPSMVGKGYRRKEVISLFEKLEELQYGEYVKGKRGGSPTKFISNDDCPASFTMIFKVFRFRKTQQEKEVDNKTTTAVANDCNYDSISAEILRSIPQVKMEACPVSKVTNGYALGVKDDKVFLVRPSQGGFDTIEKAVKASWGIFENNVTLFKSKIMSDSIQVASILRGLGFIQLKGADNVAN